MKWARVRDSTSDYFDFLAEFPAIQTQIRHWLTTGLTVSSSRTAETCRRLLDADADLWRFVAVPDLEPTTNSTECAFVTPFSGGVTPTVPSRMAAAALSNAS